MVKSAVFRAAHFSVFSRTLRGLCFAAALAGLCARPTDAAEKPKPKPAKPAQPAKPRPQPDAPKPDAKKDDTQKNADPAAGIPAAAQETSQSLHAGALAALAKGDLMTAKIGFEEVLKLSPGNVPALLNLALTEQRLSRFDEADKHLKQIISRDPENGSAWLILGISAYQREKFDAALAHLAQAVLYAPKSAQAHQYLGVTLGRKGWYSAGEEELRRALELDPKFAEAHYNLAVLYMERIPPAIELARRHYQTALDLHAPPDPDLAKKIAEAGVVPTVTGSSAH